jgi:lysozyme family protein
VNFDQAFDRLVDPEHEGGYVCNPKDPGGETKYGISKRSYPGEDIKNLTLDRAKAIYLRDFWGPAACDALPDAVKYEVFDLAVNTSRPGKPEQAVKLLQRAAGMPEEEVDGIVGKHTLMACQSMDPAKLLRRLQGLRIRFYTELGHEWFAEFGRGVMNRIADNMLEG